MSVWRAWIISGGVALGECEHSVTILMITPDYASHYLPLVAVGQSWKALGEEVIVATGPILRKRVREDGFEHIDLRLGEDGIPDYVHSEVESADELAAEIDAVRQGMVSMLTFQAKRRLRDLFWKPNDVTERLSQIHDEIEPNAIISVSLAYNATAALLALDLRFASFVTGHPSEFPAEDELYGFPYYRPSC